MQVWAGVKHVCSQIASSALSQIATQPAGAGVGGRVPTWRMVPGSSTESLALDVALQCGVPLPVVQRAAELWKVGQHDLGGSVLPDPGVDTCGPCQLCSGQLSGVGMHSVGAQVCVVSVHKGLCLLPLGCTPCGAAAGQSSTAYILEQ